MKFPVCWDGKMQTTSSSETLVWKPHAARNLQLHNMQRKAFTFLDVSFTEGDMTGADVE